MYRLLFTYFFFLSLFCYASPTSPSSSSVSVNTPGDDLPAASFVSVIITTKAQVDAAALPLLSEDRVASEDDVLQSLQEISEALSTAATSLKQLRSQPDTVVHAAYSNGRIILKRQLSDERLARVFASLIYALRTPMQSGVSSPSESVATAFRNATAATRTIISTSNQVIPGMSSLVRPLVHPLLPMLTALNLDL